MMILIVVHLLQINVRIKKRIVCPSYQKSD